jgi:formylglycine-generating enzyme required for sulfatase activity
MVVGFSCHLFGQRIAPVTGTRETPFVNSLGMKFVPLPGTKIFMCIHETRRKDFAAYAAAEPNAPSFWKTVTFENVSVGENDDHPVVMVSWDEANAFCAWLSKKEGRVYRLPMDLEWSAAVGIAHEESKTDTPEARYLKNKSRREYPWGKQWPPPVGAGNLPDTAWKQAFPDHQFIEGYTDGYATTAPVMSFKPNALGIYDLSGNVWEWCFDWRDAKRDRRTSRGGSWYFYVTDELLSCVRGGIPPDQRRPYYGFRCVVEITR